MSAVFRLDMLAFLASFALLAAIISDWCELLAAHHRPPFPT